MLLKISGLHISDPCRTQRPEPRDRAKSFFEGKLCTNSGMLGKDRKPFGTAFRGSGGFLLALASRRVKCVSSPQAAPPAEAGMDGIRLEGRSQLATPAPICSRSHPHRFGPPIELKLHRPRIGGTPPARESARTRRRSGGRQAVPNALGFKVVSTFVRSNERALMVRFDLAVTAGIQHGAMLPYMPFNAVHTGSM